MKNGHKIQLSGILMHYMNVIAARRPEVLNIPTARTMSSTTLSGREYSMSIMYYSRRCGSGNGRSYHPYKSCEGWEHNSIQTHRTPVGKEGMPRPHPV